MRVRPICGLVWLCLCGLTAVTEAQVSPSPPQGGTAGGASAPSADALREFEDLKARMRALEKQFQQQNAPAAPATFPAPKEAGDVKARLAETEDNVEVLQSKVEDLSKKLEQRVNVYLYATAAFETFRQRDALFDARNVELFVSGNITSRLKAFTEIEFERAPKTSASTGTATNRQGEVEVEQGWLEFVVSDAFRPRAGVVLVPFGRLNLDHFDPVQDLTDRPIAMRRVIPTTWGEAGLGFTGFLPAKNAWLPDLAFNYQVYAINGLTNAISDTGTRNARGGYGSDNNADKAVTGRLGIVFYPGGELGLSGYRGSLDKLGHHITGVDADWKFRKGAIELLGEYAIFGLDDALQFGSATLKVPKTMQGGYAQVNYYFQPAWLRDSVIGKGFDDPKFTAIVRYDFARIADDGDADVAANKEERWTVGLNYRPVQSYVVKMEYQWNKTRNETLERGTTNGLLMSVTAAF